MVDNVTNSNNKYTPMVNFNPFNTQQTEKQGCSKYSRTCACGHLYYLKVTFFFPVIEKFIWIESLLIGNLSYKATFSLSQGRPLKTGLILLSVDTVDTPFLPSIINVWTKYDKSRLNGIRKTDLITKNWSKFNKVNRPWKRRQGQATCTCTLHDQFVDQTNIILPRMHGIRETDLIIKNWFNFFLKVSRPCKWGHCQRLTCTLHDQMCGPNRVSQSCMLIEKLT